MQMAKELFALLNGDPLIDQSRLRQMLLTQLEWVDPTVGELLREASPEAAGAMARERQPFPMAMGGGRGSAGGRAGSSSERPMEFERAKEAFENATL